MTKWQKKLNASERRHCRLTSGTSLAAVKRNVKFQDTMKHPCWECVSIGRKLGMKVELTAFHKEEV